MITVIVHFPIFLLLAATIFPLNVGSAKPAEATLGRVRGNTHGHSNSAIPIKLKVHS